MVEFDQAVKPPTPQSPLSKGGCRLVDSLVLLLDSQDMENTDWLNAVAGGLAIAIFIGGLLMMFTTVWTTKKK